MSLLSRGSSYERPGISSRPECADEPTNEWKSGRANERTDERTSERANEELVLVPHEVSDSHHKNFNLGIFKINEPQETSIRYITCSLSQVFCSTCMYYNAPVILAYLSRNM
ncbi:hypothetical protein ALC62_10069 [Cyphomyrmex costatus]|uniref:Uncharacterized protein n=1 Tax=Cyphomyrmex costatus TaxID=456900 RepID=A0A151IEC7_9HYME|nr:hypothetical protein ALC62_10069 [Cyphomyrmex costatus]